MALSSPVKYRLSDCRAAHDRIYEVELYDGDRWVPHGQLAVIEDAITHDGVQVHTIDYQRPNHALVLTGKADDPTFRAKINLTESGTAFVGTMSVGDGIPQAIRGAELEVVYETRRRLASDPQAPMVPWENFTIKTEWVDGQLKVTYLLGPDDVSSRVRVTSVDRPKGETTLEMVAQFDPPFRQNAFVIVLTSGNHSFGGTYTDDDSTDYAWFGQIPGELAASRSAVFRAVQECRSSLRTATAPTATLSFQELDNISSIQIVTDPDGKQLTVDFAQTTCGGYFNKCLVNGLDNKWIDGIYGHPYSVPDGVQKVFNANTKFFQDESVLGTGQMLYDTLATSPDYKDLIKRIKPDAMKNAWQTMGKAENVGLTYQKVSNDLYIQGYRDGVSQMKPYLEDDPEKWAEGYYGWLTDTANLLTWQIQVASKEFDNVKTRMYEWYVKLQILAPNKDFGQKFMTIAYSALLGVNYSKTRWSDDIKPFLTALIENAIAGKIDPDTMDEIQRQAALENIELMKTLVTTADQIALLVDAIAAALTAYRLDNLQQIAQNPAAAALIGGNLVGPQYEAWSNLTRTGKVGGVMSMMFYGASAGFLLYNLVEDSKKPQTPKQVIEEINLGILTMAILVKGIERLMSLGVGRALQGFAARNNSIFAEFAGNLATWFQEGGRIVPQGNMGRAFVAVFGENSAEFLARRVGPAMAVAGLVLSAFILYDAIKSGDVRSIIFEAINTFLALATVVLIGLELLSVAWAGPVGLAVAAVGVIVLLIQLIWGWIDPPKPPADPITEFVTGPMVTQGFATP